MSLRFTLTFVLSVCHVLKAQEPSATAILSQVAQTYQGIKSQSVKATIVLDMKASPMRMEIDITGAVVKPGKVHVEFSNSMIGSETISDGRNIWKYVARFKQYTRKPTSPGIFPVSQGPGDILAGENVLDRLQSARLLRSDKLPVDGKEIDCDVIEAVYEPVAGDKTGQEGPKTLWVDKHRRIILKASSLIRMQPSPRAGALEMTQSITVTSIRIDDPLPDSLFVFVPPDGAREVAELTPPGMTAPAPQGKP
jgi:outer membrane lipoprotein-sorting protein